MAELPDPRVLGPGQAPTPFTAAEIRAGCPAGRVTRLRVDVPGDVPFLRVSRFLAADRSGVVLERSRQALDGSAVGEPESGWVSWLELQGHASFPAVATTIDTARIKTPIGTLDCLRYTVREGDAEDAFWFATALPGMPIRYVTRVAGRVTSTVSVVDNTMP